MDNIIISGQFENIGDMLHRSSLLDLIGRESVHRVFVGNNMPKYFIDALNLQDKCISHNIYAYLLRSCFELNRGDRFFFNSGEINISYSRLFKEALILPFILFMKIKGVSIVRFGVGMSVIPVGFRKKMWGFFFNLSKVTFRTSRDSLYFNKPAIRDLAFLDLEIYKPKQRLLILSLRSDRVSVSGSQLQTLKESAEANEYQMIALSQVKFDDDYMESISYQLQIPFIKASYNESYKNSLSEINEAYKKSSLVISNRIHVLIWAYTRGCKICGIDDPKRDKIKNHFQGLDYVDFKNLNENFFKIPVDLINREQSLKDMRAQILEEFSKV